LLGLLILATVCGAAQLAVAQQQRWAAVDPNSETSSPVVWAATEDEARQRAVEACKKVSKTCASGPASTNDMRETFALMCCDKPRIGCAAAAGASRRDATKSVQQMFSDAGYSDCKVRHYMSAGTGKKQ
jgi:hypothetical protein